MDFTTKEDPMTQKLPLPCYEFPDRLMTLERRNQVARIMNAYHDYLEKEMARVKQEALSRLAIVLEKEL